MGDFRSSLQGILAPIDKYDIILGKPWLGSINPRIDFRTNQVELIPGTSKLHTGASDLVLHQQWMLRGLHLSITTLTTVSLEMIHRRSSFS